MAFETNVMSDLYPVQRSAHRYPFIAEAEVTLSSEIRPARIELLSLAGAYLAMPDPFSKGHVNRGQNSD